MLPTVCWGGGIRLIVGFQPLMVISQTTSWIRWCMQVYAWWFNVDLSCLGRTIYARQFLGAKPPIQFRHRWAERNHLDHLYWLSGMPNSLMPSWEAQTSHFLRLLYDAVGDRTPASRTSSGCSYHYATWGRYPQYVGQSSSTLVKRRHVIIGRIPLLQSETQNIIVQYNVIM